jgi:hypothetical protein
MLPPSSSRPRFEVIIALAIRTLTVPLGAMLAYMTGCASWATGATSLQLYKSDPNFIWNRVHQVPHPRVSQSGQEYGSDNLDPPLWPETRYLLTGDSRSQALDVLQKFLTQYAERMIKDPLQRADFLTGCLCLEGNTRVMFHRW